MSGITDNEYIKLISQYLANAVTLGMDINYSLECRGLSEYSDKMKELVGSCYRSLALLQNPLEIQIYNENRLKPRVFDVSSLIEDISAMVRSKTRHCKIEIKRDIDKNIKAVADPERLAVCVVNLIVNAFQNVAMNEGVVRVTLKTIGGYAAVSVFDNGFGMTDEAIAEAMNSFEGTGGLEIVRRFCESVGTKPIISTDNGSGMGVTIKVPLYVDESDIVDLHSNEEYKGISSFSPSSLLIYKLDNVTIVL